MAEYPIVRGLRGELLNCQCSAYSQSECCCDTIWPESLCRDAADTIETLAAALEPFVKYADDADAEDDHDLDMNKVVVRHLRAARSALAKLKGETL